MSSTVQLHKAVAEIRDEIERLTDVVRGLRRELDEFKKRNTPTDMTDDPEYHAWVESMAKHCRCKNGDVPCAGVLAGGICDEMPDPNEGEYDPDDDAMLK